MSDFPSNATIVALVAGAREGKGTGELGAREARKSLQSLHFSPPFHPCYKDQTIWTSNGYFFDRTLVRKVFPAQKLR